MKNRSIITLIAFVLWGSLASAQNPTPDGFAYTSDGTAITVTNYTGAGGAVAIPASIGGLPVTTLGVRANGDSAFTGVSTVTSVSIPSTVTTINPGTFGVFHGCTSLTSISVNASNAAFATTADGRSLINKAGTRLVQFVPGFSGAYVIPNGIVTIGVNAFRGCTYLTGITIPTSVTSTEYGAFLGCSGLTAVALPNSLTVLGDNSFGSCTSLTSITIPGTIQHTGNATFAYCSNLVGVILGDGVTAIGNSAFSNCPNLATVQIPTTVTNVGIAAFQGCTGLTRIYFPGNAPTVGENAFLSSGLNKVFYRSGTTGWGATLGGLPTEALSAPLITAQPPSQIVSRGTTTNFSVTASGALPLSYQWRKNGTPINGATSAILSLAGAIASDAGSFDVIVTNSAGSLISSPASLAVVLSQPLSRTVSPGTNTTLYVTVAPGIRGLSYQWQKNGASITGAISSVLSLAGVSAADAAEYRCVVSDGASSPFTSTVGSVALGPTAFPNYSLFANPSQYARLGQKVLLLEGHVYSFRMRVLSPAGFTTSASPLPEFVPLDGVWADLSGSIAVSGEEVVVSGGQTLVQTTVRALRSIEALMQLAVWQPAAFRGTDIRLIDSVSGMDIINNGSFSRGAEFWNFDDLNVSLGTIFWGTQPTGGTVSVGKPFTFGTPEVFGLSPITFQWQKDGINIAGATQQNYSISTAASSDSGSYRVIATNSAGSITSAAVTLSVNPSFSVQPVSQTAASPGGTIIFSVVAWGTPPPSLQWFFNGVAIPGATNATLVLNNVQATAAGNYWVVATNSEGSVKSSTATFSLSQPGNSATQSFAGLGFVPGQPLTLTNTLTYSGTASALSWSVLLPAGWSFVSSAGSSGEQGPAAGTTEVLDWAWTTIPASPVTFTYTVNAPSTASGPQEFVALAGVRNGTSLQFLAQPDPLVATQVTTHTADTDGNYRLSLLELTRVIELFNTRYGSTRTGCYSLATSPTEDGFATDSNRTSAAVVALGRYHAADSNRDGKIGLLELTRVIELYNYRNGSTRTGQYHPQTGSEDTFAPGP